MTQPSVAPPASSDIAIIGGGMVGLSLAILLAQALPQRRILLLDSLAYSAEPTNLHQPSFDARSSALTWSSRQIFAAMGVWDQLQPQLTPVSSVHVSDRGHLNVCHMRAEDYALPALGYVAENHWLGACLLGRARSLDNIALVAPAQVEALTPVVGGYQLQLDCAGHTSSHNTALAVIADGASSQLCRLVGIGQRQSDYQQSALIANVGFSRAHQGTAYERFTDTGPLAILPRGSHQGALVWTLPRDQVDDIAALDDSALLALLQRRFGTRLGRFSQIGKRSIYPLKLTQAREQVRPHLVVMGNAAHSLHPVAGQGFNLSLRDCQALTQALAQTVTQAATDSAPLGNLASLQAYYQAQQKDQLVTIQYSHQLPRWFSDAGLVKVALRSAGMAALELIPPAKHRLALQSMGVTKFVDRAVGE